MYTSAAPSCIVRSKVTAVNDKAVLEVSKPLWGGNYRENPLTCNTVIAMCIFKERPLCFYVN